MSLLDLKTGKIETRAFRETIRSNFRDIEKATRNGIRAPLADENLPSIGFQLPATSGSGFYSQDGAYGWGLQADLLRVRAVSVSQGPVLELGPNGTADPIVDPSRISIFETDPKATADSALNRCDWYSNISTEYRLRSYARNGATLRDLVLGVDDGTFTEDLRLSKTAVVVNDPGADIDFRVEGDTVSQLLFVDASIDTAYIGSNGGRFGVGAGAVGFVSDPYLAVFCAGAGLSSNETRVLIQSPASTGTASYLDFALKTGNVHTQLIADETGSIFRIVSTLEIMRWASGTGIVMNEGGSAALDLRAEGDTDANLLFLDASADKIGIGKNNPGYKLDVAGSVVSSGDFYASDSAKGLVMKDTAGTPHYWRVTVNTAGALVTSDLGTSAP